MNTVFLLLNLAFAILCWKWANENFEKGLNYMGWVYIVASAWNAASIALILL
jgi:hypothetical protein